MSASRPDKRAETAEDRSESALAARDETAHLRDLGAEARDRAAAQRDLIAARLDRDDVPLSAIGAGERVKLGLFEFLFGPSAIARGSGRCW